jgi:hypothetical protein
MDILSADREDIDHAVLGSGPSAHSVAGLAGVFREGPHSLEISLKILRRSPCRRDRGRRK